MPRWPHWTPPRCARSSKRASPTVAWPSCCTAMKRPCARHARHWACVPCSSVWIPALPSSPPTRPTCTPPMTRSAKPSRRTRKRSWCWAVARTASARAEDGYKTIRVNCTPEPLSSDCDRAHRLYFEPLTLEDVLEVVAVEKPVGVIVQYGGQTPLKLALGLEKEGVPIIGTTPDMIDAAEDRERFQKLLHALNLKQPPNATARTETEALEKAAALGYPLVVRPSYVL